MVYLNNSKHYYLHLDLDRLLTGELFWCVMAQNSFMITYDNCVYNKRHTFDTYWIVIRCFIYTDCIFYIFSLNIWSYTKSIQPYPQVHILYTNKYIVIKRDYIYSSINLRFGVGWYHDTLQWQLSRHCN